MMLLLWTKCLSDGENLAYCKGVLVADAESQDSLGVFGKCWGIKAASDCVIVVELW